ncbi:hypothetical protein GCM10023185_43330 [Hymenobacter saemangeumensis]|uniref:Phosphatidic acid phosphatase type 2/haloperoxidase domain-containing protein n=1 Tax=Hymenobacter saemangeumensis TaxID=1084522 RepID=A0ABP8IRY1_9BACT
MNRFTTRIVALIGLLTAEVVLSILLLLAAFGLFFYLARVVFVENSVALDQWAWGIVDGWRHAAPGLMGPVRFVTTFAALPFLLPAGLVVPALLFWRGHRREAWEIVVAMAGGILLNQLLKTIFNRPRPSDALLNTYGLSFPSGHAMMAVIFYGALAWLAARHFRRPGWAVPLLLWAGLIGLTRVYLHVHYATDVLAGFAGGLAWLVVVRAGLRFFWKEEKVLLEEGEVMRK